MNSSNRKIISILLIILAVSISFCRNSQNDKFEIAVKRVRSAHNEIPVTHGLCWASTSGGLVIDSFRINLIESNLSMFYDTSLLSYTIYGHVLTKNNTTSVIKQIHVAERINNDSTLDYAGIVEITPIVTLEVAENKKKGIEYFHFTNEIALSSIEYGENIFHFKCLDKEQTISVFQSK